MRTNIIVSGDSINETTYRAYEQILSNGTKIPSRNGDCTSLYEFTYALNNARARHLNLEGRTSNIFQLVGECLWIMSGSAKVKGYLETMLPRAPQYSDDGIEWRAGYGKRIFNGNQLIDVVKFFERDGKMTRRASITIIDPNLDTFTQLKEVYGLDDSKDFACNQLMQFYVTPDDKFNLRITNRSNDAVFGMGINITEFSLIQELVYEKVRELYPELKLGKLSVYSNNFHAYDSTISQVKDVCEQNDLKDIRFCATATSEMKELGVIGTISQLRDSMIDFTETVIDQKNPKLYIDSFLERWSAVIEPSGQMADYIRLMTHYFAAKHNVQVKLDISDFQEDLQNAVISSKFRKFQVSISQVY